MPIIPRTQESVEMQVGSPVPIQGSESARQPGEQLASTGAQITKAADAVEEFQAKQLQFNRALSYQEGSSAIKDILFQGHDFAQRNSAPDGSDYQQKFDEATKQPLADAMNKYAGSDPHLQAQLGSYNNMAQKEAFTVGVVNAAKMQETNNFSRLSDQVNQSADRTRANPDPDVMSQDLVAFNKSLDASGLDPKNAEKIRDVYNNEIAKGYVDGLANQGRYGTALNFLKANQQDPNLFTTLEPAKAKDLGLIDSKTQSQLESQGKMFQVPVMSNGDKTPLNEQVTTIANGLSPKDKDTLIDRLTTKAQESSNIRLSDLHAQVSSFKEVALNGGNYTAQQFAQLKQTIATAPNMTTQAKKSVMSELNDVDALHTQLGLANTTPRSQWGTIVDGADKKMQQTTDENPALQGGDQFSAQATRLENKQKLIMGLKGIAAAQDKDPAQFVVQSDSSLSRLYLGTKDNDPGATAKYVTASLAKQDYLGVHPDKQKVLMQGEAADLVSKLQMVQDPKATAQMMQGLQAKYGPYFPRVVDELSKEDKNLAPLKYMAYASDANAVKLANAVKNKPAIDTAFKAMSQSDYNATHLQKTLSGDTLADVNKVFTADPNGGGISQLDGLRTAMETQIKSDVVRGSTVEDATKQARKDFIDTPYNVVSSDKSNLLVPKAVDGKYIDSNVVKSYVGVYSHAENFAELGVGVPPQWKDHADDYYKRLENDAAWVQSPAGDGVKLMAKGTDGQMKSVNDTFGKPIQKSFTEINQNPGKKALQNSKGFLGRIFGGS